jgi:hypothetical protein
MRKGVLLLVLFAAASLAADAAAADVFLRDACIKVLPGKDAAVRAYLRDLDARFQKVRVDEGRMISWTALRATMPTGSEVRCDYHLIQEYPSLLFTTDRMAADLQKAGLKLTTEEFQARRESLFTAKLETEGFQPFIAEVAKRVPGVGWRAWELVMPGGVGLHYNAATMDIFADWPSSVMRVASRVPAAEIWTKVHPDQIFAEYGTRYAAAVDRYRVEVFEATEVVRSK